MFDSETKRPNMRKLRLWPIHLELSGKKEALRARIGFNLEWLSAQLQFGGLDQVLENMKAVERISANNDEEIEQVRLVSQAMCHIDPQELPFQISGALSHHYKKYARLRGLIKSCDDAFVQYKGIAPLNQVGQPLDTSTTVH